MKFEITGKRYGTFTNEEGETVVYRSLYVKSPLKEVDGSECDGYTCEKIGVTRCLTDDDMIMLSVGDTINVTYNRHGKLEGVELC